MTSFAPYIGCNITNMFLLVLVSKVLLKPSKLLSKTHKELLSLLTRLDKRSNLSLFALRVKPRVQNSLVRPSRTSLVSWT
jgi:hypothetical protein